MISQCQLKGHDSRSAYDDDDEDDEEESKPRSPRQTGNGRKIKRKKDSICERARILLQPTTEWGPAIRNPLTPSRTLTHTPPSGS